MQSAWIDAVNAGDLARLLALTTDDVVFLNPGREPVGRDGFPPGFTAAHQQARIRCLSELEEVVVVGEVAYPDREVNDLGARGIGEIGLAGIAAAITAAVYHATGVRVRELPVKIEDLLA